MTLKKSSAIIPTSLHFTHKKCLFMVALGRKKNLLSSNISSRCPNNMVSFGLLAAEIDPVVWGTLANFNGFRVLAALLHGSQVVRQPHCPHCLHARNWM